MTARFAGTTSACVSHVARHLEDEFEARSIVAAFTKVNDQSVYRWLKGASMPKGEPLVRLRFYLEFLSYKVAELEVLQAEALIAGRIFSFCFTSIDHYAAVLGYPPGRIGVDALLAVLLGRRPMSKSKFDAVKRVQEEYGALLGNKTSTTKRIIGKPESDDLVLRERPLVRNRLELGDPQASCKDVAIETLAGLVRTLIPLTQMAESDEFSAEDRARLRKIAGESSVFMLANSLFRLCGERARTMHPDFGQIARGKAGSR